MVIKNILLFLIRKNFQSRLWRSCAKPFLFVGELMKQYKGRVVAEEMIFFHKSNVKGTKMSTAVVVSTGLMMCGSTCHALLLTASIYENFKRQRMEQKYC